jgi:hypothetical protein
VTASNRKLAAVPVVSPPKATPLQVLLAVANAIDDVAPDFLSRRELAAFRNIRLRKAAILEADLEAPSVRRAAA